MYLRWLYVGVVSGGLAFGQQPTPDPLTAATADDLAAGKRVYDSQCALCHGIGGTGGRGPAFTVSKLRHAADGQELIGLVINGVDGTGMPAFWFLGEKPIFQVAAYVRSLGAKTQAPPPAGNSAHGKALFKANGCGGCHVVNGEGSAYGPELTEIGAQRNAAFLRESILDPGASVPEGFALVRATPRSGRAVTGVRVNEDSFTIQLRDTAGKFHSFRKQELTDLHKDFDKSPMPAYRGKLSDADVDDLVAWLASLRGKS
jgi:cytochrome c oxidase cbb3-type subunit 3